MPHPPLFTLDPGTIEAILALIGIVFWVLNKMLGQQAPPPARRPGAPPIGRPPQRPIARPPQQGQGDPLQSEIEEFLRRASGGRKPAAQPPGAQTAARPDANRQQRGRQSLGRPIRAGGGLGSPRRRRCRRNRWPSIRILRKIRRKRWIGMSSSI